MRRHFGGGRHARFIVVPTTGHRCACTHRCRFEIVDTSEVPRCHMAVARHKQVLLPVRYVHRRTNASIASLVR